MNEPQKFTKKPVTIEAMHFRTDITAGDAHEVFAWLSDNLYPYLVGNALEPETLRYHDQVEGDDSKPDKGCYINPETGLMTIRTLEGDVAVELGDWVIKGVKGEFYPCKPDIFEATYEGVTINE